jgi:hypothetical protein
LVVIAIDGLKEGLEKVSGVDWVGWAGVGGDQRKRRADRSIGLKRRGAAASVLIPANKRHAARPAQGSGQPVERRLLDSW